MTLQDATSNALADTIARAVSAVPGVVEVYPSVVARIDRGVRDIVGQITSNLGGAPEVRPEGSSLIAIAGEGAGQTIEAHIGTDATVSTPGVARAVYDVIAGLVGPEAVISVQVSRIEWPVAPASVGSERARSADVAKDVAKGAAAASTAPAVPALPRSTRNH